MKLFIDQNVDRNTAALLRHRGFDAVDTRERSLKRTADPLLLELAAAEDRIVVTLDSGFHAMIAKRNLIKPSTILIRVHAPKAAFVCDLVESVCRQFATELLRGCLLTADEDSVRVRLLPLFPSDQPAMQ